MLVIANNVFTGLRVKLLKAKDLLAHSPLQTPYATIPVSINQKKPGGQKFQDLQC